MADRSGKAQFEVTITRLQVSTGEQADQPEHGLYMGVHVQARALSDTHEVADLEALVGEQSYGEAPIMSRAAFDPAP